MKKIKVMIVEDSAVITELLRHIIESDPRLEVVGTALSGEAALEMLARVNPDIISLDIRLPGMNGFEVTRWIMENKPTPIVVISASVEDEDLKISMNALQAGALSVLEKPLGASHADYAALAKTICNQLVIMSEVRVIQQRNRLRPTGVTAERKRILFPTPVPGDYRIMGIAASTGGPGALVKVIGKLPADFPLPILLVQHIGTTFLEGFASWFQTNCKFSVHIARDALLLQPGCIYMAAPDRHLVIRKGLVVSEDGPTVCSQRPSANVLFDSIAKIFGKSALGVLLTGMGEDGALGLKSIKDAGGYTIVEDESTAVVYGMPEAAVRLGGACESMPVHEISPRIMQLVTAGKNKR